MILRCLSVCMSVSQKTWPTSPPKLLDGFTSNFQELLLKIPIFACSSVVRLSVCQNTWVRRLTPALALKYFVLVYFGTNPNLIYRFLNIYSFFLPSKQLLSYFRVYILNFFKIKMSNFTMFTWYMFNFKSFTPLYEVLKYLCIGKICVYMMNIE